jgi:hypothetical protein
MSKEQATIRRRQSGMADVLDSISGVDHAGSPGILARVFAEVSVPTAVDRYFACHPLAVSGAEGEGSVPTLAVDASQKLYVAVLGPKVPVAGSRGSRAGRSSWSSRRPSAST